MDLPFDNHRIDDVAAVVHRDEPADLHLAGSLVYVHDADVAPERIGEIRRIVVVDCFEARFHSRRMIRISRKRYFLNRLRAIGRAFDEEFARLPL